MAAIIRQPTSTTTIANTSAPHSFFPPSLSQKPLPTPKSLHFLPKSIFPPSSLSVSLPSLLGTSLPLSDTKARCPPSAASTTQFIPNPSPSLTAQQPLQPIFHSDYLDDTDSFINACVNLLRQSVRFGDVELAGAVHASILKLEENTHLGNAVIVAYIKLGMVSEAYRVFVGLSSPNVVSYTAMVSGFAKAGREVEAVRLFSRMRSSGIEPNEYSFVAILTACIRLSHLALGFQIHAIVMKMGYLDYTFVSNALMGLYSKCGCLDFLLELFDEMSERDIASWNTVISGLAKELMYQRAYELFRNMQQSDGLKIDQFMLSILLSVSTGCFASMAGREIHAHALKKGFESNVNVNNALIAYYTKCGNVKDVEVLFERMPVKDVITWTEMITAYMEFGLVDSAVQIFDRMPERNGVSYSALLAGFCQNGEGSRALNIFCNLVKEGVEFTDLTLTSVVKACGLVLEPRISEQIHGFTVKFGFGTNAHIEAALLDMCTKCKRMADAERMFCMWPYNEESSVIWTSMICGYARNGQPEDAISLFCLSQSRETMIVDEVASTALLGVCGTLGFQRMGEQIHCHALKSGFLADVGVGNAMLSMYSNCGNMGSAIEVFNFMSCHDIISWNSLIASHLLHRQGDEALAVWSNMEKVGIKPDIITFVLIISAYKHTKSNLVGNCRKLFHSMSTVYDMEPTSEHYASLIGVLGFWDLFEEAEEVINKMPFEPAVSVWRALLDSCRIRLNTTLGKWAAKHILALEPQDPSTYILVSNLYSASGRWHCSERVREEMKGKGFVKQPGRSWMIHENRVHSFYPRDKSHSQSKDIHSGLELLILECLKAGYVPDTSFVLHEVEEYQKKDFLFYHSSKLAVTYGLLMTRPGKPVQVVKNIHLCGDCHAFFKYVSVVTRREIFVRDASGFHHFSNGQCSCNDYW